MTSIGETRQLPAEVKCFRLRRYYIVVGVFCAVFFSIIGITSTVAAYWNIDGSFPRPKLAALIFGLFWSGFLLLAVWVILAYFRERLFLAGKTIVQLSIIRSRAIDCEHVILVKWRCWPVGGSIVARTHFEKITIYLDNFMAEEREEIIRFFRETFTPVIQDNWSRFEDFHHRFSSPQKFTSRREILATALMFVCFAGIFIYVWFAGLGTQYLFFGIINAAAAFYYFWRACTFKDPRLREEVEP